MNELKKFETQQDINLLVGLFQRNGKKVAGVSFFENRSVEPVSDQSDVFYQLDTRQLLVDLDRPSGS